MHDSVLHFSPYFYLFCIVYHCCFTHPSFEQYVYASEAPLILYDAHFKGLKWQRDSKALMIAYGDFHNRWRKQTMHAQIAKAFWTSTLELLPNGHDGIDEQILTYCTGSQLTVGRIRTRPPKLLRLLPTMPSYEERVATLTGTRLRRKLELDKKRAQYPTRPIYQYEGQEAEHDNSQSSIGQARPL
jgi:hypothetical protein